MRLNRAALKLLLTSNTVLLQNQKHKKNRDGDKTVHLHILGGISLKKIYIYLEHQDGKDRQEDLTAERLLQSTGIISTILSCHT